MAIACFIPYYFIPFARFRQAFPASARAELPPFSSFCAGQPEADAPPVSRFPRLFARFVPASRRQSPDAPVTSESVKTRLCLHLQPIRQRVSNRMPSQSMNEILKRNTRKETGSSQSGRPSLPAFAGSGEKTNPLPPGLNRGRGGRRNRPIRFCRCRGGNAPRRNRCGRPHHTLYRALLPRTAPWP